MKRMIGVLALLLVAGCGGKNGGEAAVDGDPLAGTAWKLESIAKTAVLAEAPATAVFSEGRIGGSAGCNEFFASYEVEGENLRVGPAGATKKMCPPPMMDQEQSYLAFLQEATTFSLADGRLNIYRTDGECLTFASAPPPEQED